MQETVHKAATGVTTRLAQPQQAIVVHYRDSDKELSIAYKATPTNQGSNFGLGLVLGAFIIASVLGFGIASLGAFVLATLVVMALISAGRG